MTASAPIPVGADGTDYDVLVIGSGFGGSVTALRLTEKGYRVGVLEAGRRYEDQDFAKTSWDLRKFVWMPALGLYGIQRIHMLRDCLILAGAGVGGGSLNYANTLYKPPASFFADEQWAGITDWFDELSPYYDQGRRMLGVVQNPHMTPADEIVKQVADDMGAGDTFIQTPVGVYFGEPGKTVADPFFGGAGPDRTGCIECGECMTGCRHGAKNTLVKNYLGLAERAGAQVHPLTTVTGLAQRADGVWEVSTVRSGAKIRRRKRTFTAQHVVFAAGTWGTQQLLHKLRDNGSLPELSDRVGVLTRTNSESILSAVRMTVDEDLDLTRGVAITSSFHPSSDTHVEPVRYGKGSNAMGMLQTLMTDGGGRVPRWLKFFGTVLRHPLAFLRVLVVQGWSERTIIALVMQNLDNSITTFTKRGLFGRKMSSRQGHGEPNPTWIPLGNEATRRIADKIDGAPAGTWGEVFNIPMTAHFLGGCAIGADPSTGVIDPYHRVYGYPTLSVVDGSAVSANLGVNPSLTITAQAERAAALWPNKGRSISARPRASPIAASRRSSPCGPSSPRAHPAPCACRSSRSAGASRSSADRVRSALPGGAGVAAKGGEAAADPLGLPRGHRGQRRGAEPRDLERLVVGDVRLARDVAAEEQDREVLRRIAVRVADGLVGAQREEIEHLRLDARLLADLADDRLGGLLTGLEDTGDRRPLAGVGAAAQEHLAGLVDDHRGDAGQPQQVGADLLADGADVLGHGHACQGTEEPRPGGARAARTDHAGDRSGPAPGCRRGVRRSGGTGGRGRR
ncbi:hypothetical protein MTP03_05660 [Tsukamurella sp. PLM1]|nr:hypothetical protein MTP03_05660 [Tsukamurella sp. PLM1]